MYKAFVVEEHEGTFTRDLKSILVRDLPEEDLLIKVHHSSLNYKDALSISGNKGVTKSYPHTPGIDAVGTIVSSKTDSVYVDDKVIAMSYGLVMNTDDRFGQEIKVHSHWVVKLSEGL